MPRINLITAYWNSAAALDSKCELVDDDWLAGGTAAVRNTDVRSVVLFGPFQAFIDTAAAATAERPLAQMTMGHISSLYYFAKAPRAFHNRHHLKEMLEGAEVGD